MGLNLERHGFWSSDRNWNEYFKIHPWKQKLPSDNLNVWECSHCGAFNLKGTFYNEVLDIVECYSCHKPKPDREQNDNHIKGELVEVHVPRVPRSSSIVDYGRHCGNDANISFRLLNKKIIDLFHHHTEKDDYWKRRNKYIERLVNIYRPCYFAIINSELVSG